jgi:transcriptional regulator with XRE-family HTH domain/predicted transcriptional regulator
MIKEEDIIKLVFGLKIKYLRLQRQLSYQDMADLTGLSLSYLHDIENGKKYPTTKKIVHLADSLSVDYDELVSLKKAPKKLQPIVDLLRSDFLNLFPSDMFGIELSKVLELFSNAPDKLNAFLGTIFTITRNYQMRQEHFYMAALRSYQDMHDNYFGEIEAQVHRFKKENSLPDTPPFKASRLEAVLRKAFDIRIDRGSICKQEELAGIRSYFVPETMTLHLNKGLSPEQEAFLIGRELGFQFMQLTDRPYETRLLRPGHFELLLNNFKASYFSVALLMDEQSITEDMRQIFGKDTWQEDAFTLLLEKYAVTPEMLLQRLTNILPKHLGIKDLFFLRMSGSEDLKLFTMTKELHLSRQHNPYANELNETYCRRWVSVTILKRLRSMHPTPKSPITDAQISRYWKSPNEYLCISLAKAEQGKKSVSVTIGLMLNDNLRNHVRFLNDRNLKLRTVNTTCQRCDMPDCAERQAAPSIIERENDIRQIFSALENLKKG